MTPTQLLRRHGFTRDVVLDAIDYAIGKVFYGQHMRIAELGLCEVFDRTAPAEFDAYETVPAVLRSLGGRPRDEFFWAYPTPSKKQAAQQRLMMLAFMLEWTSD